MYSALYSAVSFYQMSVLAAVINQNQAAAIIILEDIDGRSVRGANVNKVTFPNPIWNQVKGNEDSGEWFRKTLRMSMESFLRIVGYVENEWEYVLPLPSHNAKFGIIDRVAVTIHYLTTEGNESQVGKIYLFRFILYYRIFIRYWKEQQY